MATAASVCHQCGNALNAASKFCTECGAQVDLSSPPPLLRPAICAACGHVNAHGDVYCESCGAKLAGRIFQNASSPAAVAHQTTAQPKQSPAGPPASGGILPWHIGIGVITVAIIGVFIYVESQRIHPPAMTPGSAMRFPSGQSPAVPPSQNILDAIQRLETIVAKNPGDTSSKLLLANALHDAGMHDPAYLPRAIEAYKTFLNVKPNDPNARVDLGICYFEIGKLDSTRAGEFYAIAVKEMEAALKADPKHQPGAFNLGIVHLYSGNVRESNKWFKVASDLNPESDLGKRAKAILEQHSQAM